MGLTGGDGTPVTPWGLGALGKLLRGAACRALAAVRSREQGKAETGDDHEAIAQVTVASTCVEAGEGEKKLDSGYA